METIKKKERKENENKNMVSIRQLFTITSIPLQLISGQSYETDS